MKPSWLQAVHDVLPDEASTLTLRPLVLSHADPDLRGVKILIFANDEREPRWILRCHGDAAVTIREGLILTELQRLEFRAQPGIMGQGTFEDMHALLLAYCRGTHAPPRVWLRSDAIATLMRELARLQLAVSEWTRVHLGGSPANAAELLEAARFVSPVPVEAGPFTRAILDAQHCLSAAGARELPQHGDFWTSNVLWHRGEIRVIDWEQFGFVVEPFMDVWTFIISLCDDVQDHGCVSLFQGGGPVTAAADRAVRAYAECVGLPPRSGREAFPLVLSRFIHYNASHQRTWIAGRMSRLLGAYLANSEGFMPSLTR